MGRLKMKDEALETIGTIIDESKERDAIHVAVIPAQAGQALEPGWRVRLEGKKAYSDSTDPIGIVDPFLRGVIVEGEWFWLCLMPRTITSLRHVWTHPGITGEAQNSLSVAASEEWLVNWCSMNDCPDWATLKQGFEGTLHTDGYYRFEYEDYGDGYDYIHVGAYHGHAAIPDEFWAHVENVIGKKVPRAKYFTCSC